MAKKDKKAAAAKRGKGNVTAAPSTQGVGLGDFDTTPVPEAKVKAKKERAEGAMPELPKLPAAKRARKPRPLRDCTCGCGGQTAGSWVPGHDARAKGWALRIERGICKMSDVPANERKGAQFMIDNPAPAKAKADIKLVGKEAKAVNG